MQIIIDLCNRAKQLNENKLLIDLFQNVEFRNAIIQANKDQLFNFGIDNNANKLRSKFARAGEVYSEFTIREKLNKSPAQPTDRITLKDTGEFYDSFNLQIVNKTLVIDADTNKETNDLAYVWGLDILGLTELESIIAIELAREIIIPIIINKLLNV